jgi:hypothetical protein
MGLVGAHAVGAWAKASAGKAPTMKAKPNLHSKVRHGVRAHTAFNTRPDAARFIFVSSLHKGDMPWAALLALPLYFFKLKQLTCYDTTVCAYTRRKLASLDNNRLRRTFYALANVT